MCEQPINRSKMDSEFLERLGAIEFLGRGATGQRVHLRQGAVDKYDDGCRAESSLRSDNRLRHPTRDGVLQRSGRAPAHLQIGEPHSLQHVPRLKALKG
jgi:hypothetical protein